MFSEGTSVESYKDIATSSFIYCSFTSAFLSADFIIYNFLELYSTLSEKRFLSQIFLF